MSSRTSILELAEDPLGRPVVGATMSVADTSGNPLTLYAAPTGATTTSGVSNSYGEQFAYVEADEFDVTQIVNGRTVVKQVRSRLAVLEDSAPYVQVDTSLISGSNVDVAVADAKTRLGPTPGRIVLPRGALTFTDSFPSFHETYGYWLQGGGGLTGGATPGTTLTYTGTGVRGIDARSAVFNLQDLMLLYNQSGFTGALVDCSHSIVQDAQLGVLQGCYFGSSGGIRTAAALLSLDNAISIKVRDCSFQDAVLGVRGKATTGHYSNAISLDHCHFLNLTTCGAQGAGQAWKFDNCIFEPLSTGAAGAYRDGSSGGADGVTFDDCWFGDANTSGTWIDWAGNALTVRGGEMANGAVGVATAANSFATSILGVEFESITTHVSLGTSNHGTSIRANNFKTGTTAVAFGSSADALEIVANNFDTGLTTSVAFGVTPGFVIVEANAFGSGAYTFAGNLPSAGRVQLSGQTINCGGGGAYLVNGAVSDASFPATPPNGTAGFDYTNSKWYVKVGAPGGYAGTWKSTAALT